MLIAWLIGVFLNLTVLYLWYNGKDYDGERIPINIIVFILLIILGFTPIVNIVIGVILLVIIFGSYVHDDIEFKGPKWMIKTIK